MLYNFRANAGEETLLKLDTSNPDFAFSAEVRDSSGETIAVLEGDRLKGAKLTLEPGDELYQIALSAAAPDRPGSVALTVGAPICWWSGGGFAGLAGRRGQRAVEPDHQLPEPRPVRLRVD